MNIKIIITCILCSIALAVSAQIDNLPRKTLNGKEYYVYKVSKGETIYSISRKFNISESDVVKYNPSVKKGLKRDQMLFLPINDDAVAESEVAENNYFVHTVRRGESLYAIAKMYNVTIDGIRELNPGITNLLDVGDKLNIPQKGNKKDVVSEASQSTSDAPKEEKKTTKDDYLYHTIRSGETLYAISSKYDVTVKEIIKSNPGIKPNKLYKGSVIRIPVKQEVVESVAEQPVVQQDIVAAVDTVAQEGTTATLAQYDVYEVKKRETYYSISQKLGISQETLREANPGVRVVKEGMKINVPKVQPEENVLAESVEENTSEYLDNVYTQLYEKKDADYINVAVILPFMLKEDESNVKSSLYTEYYQGFLLAVDSLKRQGYSINVYAYDSQDSLAVVQEILEQEHMTTMNLIIAPENDEAINLIADFGEKHDINVVNNFSLKNDRVNTNARVFQTNIPGSYLYAESASLFVKTFNNKTVVFLNNKDVEDGENEFVATLKEELNKRGKTYMTCDYSTVLYASDLRSVAKESSIVFVPTSNKKEALVTMLTGLEEFVNNNPYCDVSLFGYPGWVPQISKNVNKLYKLDTYIFSRFYTVPDDTMLYDFSIKYLYWYNEEMKNASPRYAILGFDTGLYFMNAIAKYGQNFANYEIPAGENTIQTGFKFERISNWSGFINKSFYFVHLSPDMKIEKIAP